MSQPSSFETSAAPALRQFIQYAVTSPSADNSQPWVFERDGDTVVCRYRHVGDTQDPFGANGHGTLIAAGALHENIDRLLAMLGMEGAQRDLSPNWTLRFALPVAAIPDTEELRAMLGRHTNRHPYRRIEHPNFENLQSVALGSGRLVVVEDRGAIKDLGRAVKMCAEARFNTEPLHDWLFGSLRWTPDAVADGDGLDLATIYMPPGGRLFMRLVSPWPRMALLNRFGFYKLLALTDTDPVNKAPCMIAIVGKRSPEGIWNAGRLMQQLWIDLNRRGYAVHPYYVVTDLTNRLDAGGLDPPWRARVADAKAIASSSLCLGAADQLHMMLRVGWPTKDPVRSRRRPAGSFLLSIPIPRAGQAFPKKHDLWL